MTCRFTNDCPPALGQRSILLTGASGFIGRVLAPLILERGYGLRVLVRDPDSLRDCAWRARAEVVRGDLRTPADLAAACEGVDGIIHCAGLAHRAEKAEAHWDLNHQATVNLLHAAIAAKVPRLLFLSSSKAATARDAYGAAKRKAEEDILAAHHQGLIRACCLRPVAVYGPGMKGNLVGWMKLTRKGVAPPLPPVQTRIALIGVRDLARAILDALESDRVWGKCYHVSDGRPYGIKDIETSIRQAVGRGPARFWLPKPCFALAATAADALRNWGGITVPFGRGGYNALFLDEYTDDDAFRRDTGFVPRQDFRQELPALIEEQ